MAQNRITIEMPILEEPKVIVLSSFRSKENSKYYILDTGAVLKLLSRLHTLFFQLDRKQLNLAIPQKTIEQVVEHLYRSFFRRKKQLASMHDVEEGMRNFVKLLDSEKLKKISNPEEIPKAADKEKYKRFEEDAILTYLLYEGHFKGIITQDGQFGKKIPKDKEVLNCSDLLE